MGLMSHRHTHTHTRVTTMTPHTPLQASLLARRPVRGAAVWLSKREGCHLHSLMRPELVRRNPEPLSSDAFTGFGWHDAKRHNGMAAWRVCVWLCRCHAHSIGVHLWVAGAARRATELLRGKLVPAFARELSDGRVLLAHASQLSDLMHARGECEGLSGTPPPPLP